MVIERGWTGREAADAVGITYRQLDYWARTDLVRPSISGEGLGSGYRRRYSDEDVATLRLVKELLDAGQRLEAIRAVIRLLDRSQGDLHHAILVISAGTARVVQDPQELVDMLLEHGGVLTVRSLSTLRPRPADTGTTS